MRSHASAYEGEFYELDEPVWNENRVWITEQERKWKDRHSGNKERHHANNQQQPQPLFNPILFRIWFVHSMLFTLNSFVQRKKLSHLLISSLRLINLLL